jgi:hypothetical protein
MHRGAYGNVYLAQRNGEEEFNYVAKVMKLRRPEERVHFALESCLATRAGEQGYGPRVASCYIATKTNTGVIVMERWYDDMDDKKISKPELYKILEVVRRMHDDRVFHQDLYFRNVLCRRNPGTQENEYCITDYGLAFPMREVTPELRAADIVSLLYGEYEPAKNMFDYGIRRINITREGILVDSYGIDGIRRILQFSPKSGGRGSIGRSISTCRSRLLRSRKKPST